MVGSLNQVEIVLEAPDRIRVGTKAVRVGGVVYRSLACLLGAGGQVSVEQFEREVWGHTVSRLTLSSALWRLNTVFRGNGFERVATLDGESVRLE